MHAAIDLTVPMSTSKGRKFPDWFSNGLKKNILLKKQLHREWKITNNLEVYIQFKRVRALCIKIMKESHNKHISYMQTLAK